MDIESGVAAAECHRDVGLLGELVHVSMLAFDGGDLMLLVNVPVSNNPHRIVWVSFLTSVGLSIVVKSGNATKKALLIPFAVLVTAATFHVTAALPVASF